MVVNFLGGGRWWWVVVDIFWLVVGGGGWWWMVVGHGGWSNPFLKASFVVVKACDKKVGRKL